MKVYVFLSFIKATFYVSSVYFLKSVAYLKYNLSKYLKTLPVMNLSVGMF